MEDRDWPNVICTTARGEWVGGAIWFIPDLWELTKERCPEHREPTVYGRVAPQRTLKIITSPNSLGNPRKPFSQPKSPNFNLWNLNSCWSQKCNSGEKFHFRKNCRPLYICNVKFFEVLHCIVPSMHDSNTHRWYQTKLHTKRTKCNFIHTHSDLQETHNSQQHYVMTYWISPTTVNESGK